MSDFIDAYRKLLIIQYADKPKAKQHIEAIVSKPEEVYHFANSLEDALNLDTAVGVQLDIIGKIVGISRVVPFSVRKDYFGFDGHEFSYPMDNKFLTVESKPFRDRFEPAYTSGELNDSQYRFFLRGKIMRNYAKGTMIDEEGKLSIQNSVDFLFEGDAYVVDNQDMTLNLYINQDLDLSMIQYIKQLDLIPRPQGVGYYKLVTYQEPKPILDENGNPVLDENGNPTYEGGGGTWNDSGVTTFGFYSNNSGFGDKFSGEDDNTYFANKILL